jgi:hypothetical protein
VNVIRLATYSRCALAAIALLFLAILADVASWLEAQRMEAAGQGWEMAFYFSPLAFWTVDTLLVLSCMAALVGTVLGPGIRPRLICLVILSLGAGRFMTVPWRGGLY